MTQECSVPKCQNLAISKGLCTSHKGRRLIKSTTDKQRLGKRAEYNFKQLAVAHGRAVVRMGYNAPYDFLVDGLRVELKCARPQMTCNGPLWVVNIHRHGKVVEDCDLYIFRLEEVPWCKAALHLAFKSPMGSPTITFTFRSILKRWAHGAVNFEALMRGDKF